MSKLFLDEGHRQLSLSGVPHPQLFCNFLSFSRGLGILRYYFSLIYLILQLLFNVPFKDPLRSSFDLFLKAFPVVY